MGLFNLFGSSRKKDQEKQKEGGKDEWVTVEVRKSQLDDLNEALELASILENSEELEELYQKIKEDEARAEREYEEQQMRRKEALEERGVLVGSITVEKGRKDLFETVGGLCRINFKKLGPCEREVVAWQALTKTGKVPKCVAHYVMMWPVWDGYSRKGPLVCEIGYLADGTPYTAWVSDSKLTKTYYNIKMVDGELAVVAKNPI